MSMTKLTVPDLSCDHCERTVTDALTPLSGVHQVAVDLPTKTILVTYDPQMVSITQLRDVLAEESYPVSVFEEAGGN